VQNSFIAFLLFIAFPIFTVGENKQRPSLPGEDTIFIYKTVTVYDTIIVHDTVRVMMNEKIAVIKPSGTGLNLLLSDSTNNKAKIIVIFDNQAATIPINSIISGVNNQKLKGMKKLNFLGVVLLAFQSMVMAQTNYGISAGGGMWWAWDNNHIGSVVFSPAVNTGLFFELPLSKRIWLKTELNYVYLSSNYSYKAVIDTLNRFEVGDGESASAYHQFAVPLEIGYKIGGFKLAAGLEYAYRMSESWLNKNMNCLALSFSVNHHLANRLSISLYYKYGLTKDYEYSGQIKDPVSSAIIGEYDNYWKSNRIGLTLYYAFPKHKEKQEKK
jgi:hypothetical protein